MLQKEVESIGEAKVSKFEICTWTEMGLGQAITLLFYIHLHRKYT